MVMQHNRLQNLSHGAKKRLENLADYARMSCPARSSNMLASYNIIADGSTLKLDL